MATLWLKTLPLWFSRCRKQAGHLRPIWQGRLISRRRRRRRWRRWGHNLYFVKILPSRRRPDSRMLCIKTGCVVFGSVQEATSVTLEEAALHSETQMTFSGNSSEAEIHLQISLVSAVSPLFFPVFWFFFFKVQKTWRALVSIINSQDFFSWNLGQKYTQLVRKGLRG